ncbi:gp16 family protein [Ideonella dechloratans]|uniref:gp16 family protein n=1 Tax=Ideonella dechloratans TaxID=36863 RepID=UPI0035AF2169
MTAKPEAKGNQARDAARKRELQLIHIAKGQLGLGDDAYRDLLSQVTGKRSAAELTGAQRRQFLDHLKRCGWQQVQRPNPQRNEQPAHARAPGDVHAERWEKARQLWALLCRAGAVQADSDEALLAWVQRQHRVAAWRWLNTHQINTVVESLKKWCRRVGADLQ